MQLLHKKHSSLPLVQELVLKQTMIVSAMKDNRLISGYSDPSGSTFSAPIITVRIVSLFTQLVNESYFHLYHTRVKSQLEYTRHNLSGLET